MAERPIAPNPARNIQTHVHGGAAFPSTSTLALRKPKYHRTRTGCRTCKTRKIRCDRTRPVCHRCSSTGRECGGYPEVDRDDDKDNVGILIRKKSDSSRLSSSPRPTAIPAIGSDPIDLRYFELFQRSATTIIPGHTPMATWKTLIPQLCHSEPAIANAALAISALHEETEFARRSVTDAFNEQDLSPAHAYALKHYGIALNLIQHKLDKGDSSPFIVLVACIVFVAFESMRGHRQAAITHIQSGNRILEGILQPSKTILPTTLTTYSSTQRDAISAAAAGPLATKQEPGQGHSLPQFNQDSELNAMFRSFSKLSSLIGSAEEQNGESPPPAAATLPAKLAECPDYFRTLDEARGVLFSLMNSARGLVFLCLSQLHERNQIGPETGHACILFLDGQLRRWSNALDQLQQRSSDEAREDPSAPPEDSEIVLLRLWRKFVSIRLWAVILPSEASFDALTPDFEEVLDICERCINLLIRQHDIRRGTKDHRPPAFIMDMGVLPILFFVGRRCSSQAIKLRALRLVDRAPRLEALWDGEIVKAAINKAIHEQIQKDRVSGSPDS